MTRPSRDQYLESKVFTASQPQLHVMLLDGALRFGKQAQELWAEDADFLTVEPPLMRMFDIVEELVQGLTCGEGKISEQLAEQYAFVYHELGNCRINKDLQPLDGCLEVLSFQRETWKLACEQMETDPKETDPKETNSTNATVAQAKPTMPPMPHMPPSNLSIDTSQVSAGFSLEA